MKELGEIIRIEKGAHTSPQDGNCAMELVAFMAGEAHSDHPQCASPVIGDFVRPWNDSMADDERQELAPYLIRMIGTRGTEKQEHERRLMIRDWVFGAAIPMNLRAAGFEEQAAEGLRKFNANADADAYAYGHAYADAYVYADAYAYAYAYGHAYADAYAYVDAYVDAYVYADAYAYAYAYGHAYADAYADAYVYGRYYGLGIRCVALKAMVGSKSRDEAVERAVKAVKPAIVALKVSAFDLLNRLIRVTEDKPTTSIVIERVEQVRKAGVPV